MRDSHPSKILPRKRQFSFKVMFALTLTVGSPRRICAVKRDVTSVDLDRSVNSMNELIRRKKANGACIIH